MTPSHGIPWAPSAPALQTRLRGVVHVALDMDGTIYKGGTLFSCTAPFLAGLKELGIGYTFLTNNPSRSLPTPSNLFRCASE